MLTNFDKKPDLVSQNIALFDHHHFCSLLLLLCHHFCYYRDDDCCHKLDLKLNSCYCGEVKKWRGEKVVPEDDSVELFIGSI